MNSWQTSVAGIATIVVAVGTAVKMLVDGDASTNPDWNLVVAAVMSGIGLIFARDNSRTSESAGAK